MLKYCKKCSRRLSLELGVAEEEWVGAPAAEPHSIGLGAGASLCIAMRWCRKLLSRYRWGRFAHSKGLLHHKVPRTECPDADNCIGILVQVPGPVSYQWMPRRTGRGMNLVQVLFP